MEPSLTSILQALYRSEINCSISCFWDAGWDVKLGDEMNGWRAHANFTNDELDEIGPWLIRAAKREWPESEFARNFGQPEDGK